MRAPLGLEGLREAARRPEDAGIPGRRVIMPFRKLNPTSPGTRFQTVQTFEITTQEPHKPLVEPLHSTGAATIRGTSLRGGAARGHSGCPDHRLQARQARHREGVDDRIRPEPFGADRAADLRRRREAVHPAAARPQGGRHDRRRSDDGHPAGNCLPLKNIPLGTQLHNVELRPGKAGKSRAAPDRPCSSSRGSRLRVGQMPSGEIRKINMECFATVGRSATSITRTCRSAKRAGAAGWVSGRTCAASR